MPLQVCASEDAREIADTLCNGNQTSIEQENNPLHAYLVRARAEQKSKSGTFWHSHMATYVCGTDDLGLVHTATEVRVKGSKDKNTRVKHVRGHQTSSFIQFTTFLAPLLRNGTC